MSAVTGTRQAAWRVVLADDDAPLRALLRHAVGSDERFVVVAEAIDGTEALAALERHDPDLLLLDLAMPRMDGIAVLEQLDDRPRPIVVVLTGVAEPEMRAAAELRAAAVFVKDVAFQDLPERLAQVLT